MDRSEKISVSSDAATTADSAMSIEQVETGVPAERHGNMRMWQAALTMIAATNSLGELALPAALAPLGVVPAAFVILVLGVVNWFTGHVVYLFCKRHPEAHSYAACMARALGPMGRYLGIFMQTAVTLLIMAAHLVGWRIMLETLSSNKVHGVVAVLIGLAGMAIWTISRAVKDSWFLSLISLVSVVAAIIVAAVGSSLANAGSQKGQAFASMDDTSLDQIGNALSSILFVLMGHVTYPTIIAEMKDPEGFPKALGLQAVVTTTMCLIVSIFFCVVAGPEIESPIISSAPPLLAKVAYGLSIPTILVAAVISCMVAAHDIYERAWTAKDHPDMAREQSARAKFSRWGIIAVVWGAAVALALGIPEFDRIIPLCGAIFGPSFCLIIPSLFWLQMYGDGSWSTLKASVTARPYQAGLVLCVFMMGWVLLALGVYGSAIGFTAVEIMSLESGGG